MTDVVCLLVMWHLIIYSTHLASPLCLSSFPAGVLNLSFIYVSPAGWTRDLMLAASVDHCASLARPLVLAALSAWGDAVPLASGLARQRLWGLPAALNQALYWPAAAGNLLKASADFCQMFKLIFVSHRKVRTYTQICIQEWWVQLLYNKIKIRLKMNWLLSLDLQLYSVGTFLKSILKIAFTEVLLFSCSHQFLILVPTKYCVSVSGWYVYF